MTEFREKVAELCHSQWSNWQRYLFSKCTGADKPPFVIVIPEQLVLRWRRQMETDYADLSPEEQDSDREEADKFIALFAEELERDLVRGAEDVLDELIEAETGFIRAQP